MMNFKVVYKFTYENKHFRNGEENIENLKYNTPTKHHVSRKKPIRIDFNNVPLPYLKDFVRFIGEEAILAIDDEKGEGVYVNGESIHQYMLLN